VIGSLPKALIVAGVVLVVVGLLGPWLGKLPLGRLPGDIMVDREGFRILRQVSPLAMMSAPTAAVQALF